MSKIAMCYDTDLKRPGCVLLQAAMGGDVAACQKLFDPQDWIIHPTPGLKLLEATQEQWEYVAALTEANRV